jgi:hypothetical protein
LKIASKLKSRAGGAATLCEFINIVPQLELAFAPELVMNARLLC